MRLVRGSSLLPPLGHLTLLWSVSCLCTDDAHSPPLALTPPWAPEALSPSCPQPRAPILTMSQTANLLLFLALVTEVSHTRLPERAQGFILDAASLPNLRSHSLHKRSPTSHFSGLSASNEVQFYTSPLLYVLFFLPTSPHKHFFILPRPNSCSSPPVEMLSDNQTSPDSPLH